MVTFSLIVVVFWFYYQLQHKSRVFRSKASQSSCSYSYHQSINSSFNFHHYYQLHHTQQEQHSATPHSEPSHLLTLHHHTRTSQLEHTAGRWWHVSCSLHPIRPTLPRCCRHFIHSAKRGNVLLYVHEIWNNLGIYRRAGWPCRACRMAGHATAL